MPATKIASDQSSGNEMSATWPGSLHGGVRSVAQCGAVPGGTAHGRLRAGEIKAKMGNEDD